MAAISSEQFKSQAKNYQISNNISKPHPLAFGNTTTIQKLDKSGVQFPTSIFAFSFNDNDNVICMLHEMCEVKQRAPPYLHARFLSVTRPDNFK